MRDGKIASVSAGAAPEPGAPVVDGKGKHVYPSLFPPMTVLGLEEIDAVRATVDKQELGGINPAARADVAINYDSELLPVARSGGVLVAGVTPIGGIIAGTGRGDEAATAGRARTPRSRPRPRSRSTGRI